MNVISNVRDSALKNFFLSRSDIFGENSSFRQFKHEINFESSEGLNSGAIFGYIEYENNEETRTSPFLLLKLSPNYMPFPDFHVYTFMNEIFFYTRVIPFFSTLRTIDFLFAKFYGSEMNISVGNLDGVIIFENLQAVGYTNSEKKSFLDYDHLQIMMKKLGEYHAYSYAARNADENHFLALCSAFVHTDCISIRRMTYLLPKIALRGLQTILDDPKYCSKVTDLKKIIGKSNEFMREVYTEDRNNPVSVLCHGDYLRSNVLFKYDNGKPIDMKMIDMASCKLASPILDLASVLYLHADQRMRDQHWSNLIDDYYAALNTTFPEGKASIPGKDCILREFKRKSFHIYFIASYFLNILIAIDNNMPTDSLRPPEYKEYRYSTFPEDIYLNYLEQVGGTVATEALGNILKDMIDREFI